MDRAVNRLLAALLAAMLLVIAAQVWYRFVLNDPLSWSEELGRYLFVWLSFLGAAAGVRYQVHLGLDLFGKRVPAGLRRRVLLLANLLAQAFLIVVVFQGFRILGVVRFQSSPSLGISMAAPYLAVPVGALLMLVNSIRVSAAIVAGKGLDPEIRA